MPIVSNTSPISNLARIGQLDLIREIYGEIIIPSAVYAELLDERAGKTVNKTVRASHWLKIHPVQNQQLIDKLRTVLNFGEAEAIALAVEMKATRLLIDEKLGRRSAKELGLRIIGVLGILLQAKRQNIITTVKPIIDALKEQANFRISDQLYADVLSQANES